MAEDKLLKLDNLVLYFKTMRGPVQAVDGVSFELGYKEAVVVLGESGCGKSSLAKAILRLLPRNAGQYTGKVYLDDLELMGMGEEEFRQNIRWAKISMVPQAAMNSLNPVLKVGDQVAEPMMIHLVTAPALIILDEPTSALDVLTQANIMNVLKRIKTELEISYILITHDIATSSELADRVAVMYAGQIVETSDAMRFFTAPLHPYSQKLMASVPRLRGDKEPEFITGQPPSLLDPPKGCRFASRCSFRFERCDQDPPVIEKEGRKVRCWLHV
jgi:peptide/nickel transport system ATP-binding protein